MDKIHERRARTTSSESTIASFTTASEEILDPAMTWRSNSIARSFPEVSCWISRLLRLSATISCVAVVMSESRSRSIVFIEKVMHGPNLCDAREPEQVAHFQCLAVLQKGYCMRKHTPGAARASKSNALLLRHKSLFLGTVRPGPVIPTSGSARATSQTGLFLAILQVSLYKVFWYYGETAPCFNSSFIISSCPRDEATWNGVLPLSSFSSMFAP